MSPAPKLPPVADSWTEETKELAREMIRTGERWRKMRETQAEVSARRLELFLALEAARVSHAVIGQLAGTTKGAVEQALVAHRKKAS